MSTNVFKVMMKSSRKNDGTKPVAKRTKSEDSGTTIAIRNAAGSNFWKKGLIEALKNPENVVESSDTLVVIKDKYPKAKFHYLILPKASELNSARELTNLHINLLNDMKQKAEHLINHYHPNTEFKIGFHAKPSMEHLHLHVVSTDFISPCLKTKQHWNSFNTEHFINLSEIILMLEQKDQLEDYPTDESIASYLKKPLKCNQCAFEAKTMPNLKTHLASHASLC